MTPKPDPVEPLWQRLPRLRDERGLSRSRLSRATARLGDEGLSEETIKRLEAPPDGRQHRQARISTVMALARALEVEPEEFPEYVLARVRELFDERVVGLDEAMASLERHPELREAALRRSS